MIGNSDCPISIRSYQYKVDFNQDKFLFNQIGNSDNMVNVYVSGKIIFDKN